MHILAWSLIKVPHKVFTFLGPTSVSSSAGLTLTVAVTLTVVEVSAFCSSAAEADFIEATLFSEADRRPLDALEDADDNPEVTEADIFRKAAMTLDDDLCKKSKRVKKNREISRIHFRISRAFLCWKLVGKDSEDG